MQVSGTLLYSAQRTLQADSTYGQIALTICTISTHPISTLILLPLFFEGHVVTALNKLDCGDPEQVRLSPQSSSCVNHRSIISCRQCLLEIIRICISGFLRFSFFFNPLRSLPFYSFQDALELEGQQRPFSSVIHRC